MSFSAAHTDIYWHGYAQRDETGSVVGPGGWLAPGRGPARRHAPGGGGGGCAAWLGRGGRGGERGWQAAGRQAADQQLASQRLAPLLPCSPTPTHPPTPRARAGRHHRPGSGHGQRWRRRRPAHGRAALAGLLPRLQLGRGDAPAQRRAQLCAGHHGQRRPVPERAALAGLLPRLLQPCHGRHGPRCAGPRQLHAAARPPVYQSRCDPPGRLQPRQACPPSGRRQQGPADRARCRCCCCRHPARPPALPAQTRAGPPTAPRPRPTRPTTSSTRCARAGAGGAWRRACWGVGMAQPCRFAWHALLRRRSLLRPCLRTAAPQGSPTRALLEPRSPLCLAGGLHDPQHAAALGWPSCAASQAGSEPPSPRAAAAPTSGPAAARGVLPGLRPGLRRRPRPDLFVRALGDLLARLRAEGRDRRRGGPRRLAGRPAGPHACLHAACCSWCGSGALALLRRLGQGWAALG
jgi:hypothetical protein